MAFEVSCSQCQGRLMVEQAGQVVACPHCGTHLAIPDAEPTGSGALGSPDDTAPEAPAIETEQPPEVVQSETAVSAFAQETQDEIPVFNPAEDQPVAESPDDTLESSDNADSESVAVSADNPFASGAPDFSAGFGDAPANGNPFAGGDFNFGDADAGSVTTVSEFVPTPVPGDDEDSSDSDPAASKPVGDAAGATDAAEQTAHETPSASVEAASADEDLPELSADNEDADVPAAEPVGQSTPAALSAAPAYQPPVQTPADTVPRSKYVLVLSWASAATIAALFLAYLLTTSQTSQLESLPDVKPPKKDDKIVYKLVPEDAAMPPGHVLALGDTQRYGNLKVTALRVTRGPVQFEHYDASSNRTRDDGPEVLKLWLRFENVSSDQSIAPLDELIFQRDDRDFENVRANIFLARTSQKSKAGTRLMVYDLNTDGDWNLKSQQVHHEISPGGQLETYIPTTPEGLGDVLGSDEELVWRVHFRKGYSPKNYGVTTVIEVTFNESDIEADSASASTPADSGDNAPKA
jgi:hypothetical protein